LLSEYFNGKELNLSINPEETIAYGAAIIADELLNPKYDSFSDICCFIDATPLSIGLDTVGGIMTKVIHKNTVIPTK
jgi:L1 cell adhesion molecule like protein